MEFPKVMPGSCWGAFAVSLSSAECDISIYSLGRETFGIPEVNGASALLSGRVWSPSGHVCQLMSSCH